MTSANFLWLLKDFVPEYHHAKFGCNWSTNKGEAEGGGGGHNVPLKAYMVPKDHCLNRLKGLAKVVKNQHSAHKAEQETHLKAMKSTNEHISHLTATVEGLSKFPNKYQHIQQPITNDYACQILFSPNIRENSH